MKSAITVSLVPQARGGPFVFWDDLEAACAQAAEFGFTAIEIFPPSAAAVDPNIVIPLLRKYRLELAAVGTGAGWVVHRWHFTNTDAGVRGQAREFAYEIVRAAGQLGAPAIIGSMQGKIETGDSREQALGWLGEALEELAGVAAEHGQMLLYEPLNRYETNLLNRLDDTLEFLGTLKAPNIKILADLFHMNLEERDIAEALQMAGDRLGHVHYADSNRRAVGMGHTDVLAAAQQLAAMNYRGYISAEVLPLPSPAEAARQTMASFRSHFTLK